MVTAIKFELPEGTKMVSLADIVMFLFDQVPPAKKAEFLKNVEPFNPMGG